MTGIPHAQPRARAMTGILPARHRAILRADNRAVRRKAMLKSGIPPARRSRIVAGLVLAGFAASWAAGKLPVISGFSGGTRTIVLTVLLAGIAALLFPVQSAHYTEEEMDA